MEKDKVALLQQVQQAVGLRALAEGDPMDAAYRSYHRGRNLRRQGSY